MCLADAGRVLRRIALVAIVPLSACSDVCYQQLTPDDFKMAGSASGVVELQTTSGTSSRPFDTRDGTSTSFDGEVIDGSGGTGFGVELNPSRFEPEVFFETELPDVRALQSGAVITVPADGSIVFADNDYCNFNGTATATITQAVGSQAAEPKYVTDDFMRSADLQIDVTAFSPGVADPTDPLPECPTSLGVRASLALAASGYSAVYHYENCPDLSLSK